MTKRFFIISFILLGLTGLANGQKTIPAAKQKLVSELIVRTSAIIPSETIDSLFIEVQMERAGEMEKGITNTIVAKIDASDKLSAQEKADIKAKVPELSQKLAYLSKDYIGKGFNVKKWIDDAFQKNYSGKFTISELRQLNAYFQTADGKKVVKLFRRLIIGEITDEKKDSDAKTDILMEKFLKKPFAEKFFNVLLENIFGEVIIKTDAWSKNALRKIDKSMENGEMKKLLEEFIVANVKP